MEMQNLELDIIINNLVFGGVAGFFPMRVADVILEMKIKE